ncbi:hypothetical protein ABH920_006992 [Catenulispora sp. EB89]|uniref:hypothetical protein n=1 Tax=Catenulispora sp. EB89 TaxID=3156257 RepID=UPI0035134EEC
MCHLRRTIRTRKAASRSAPSRLVREAEAIVHGAWIAQLAERREEMEAALRRAAARCDDAQQSLTAAQHSGDPQQIARSHRDLAKAVEAARKTSLAWERTCHVLGVEAGLSPRRGADPRRGE